jgi:hypothetical protein
VSAPPANLSTAAISGIAISVSLAAVTLIGALVLLWRKKRTAEAKRQNDLEAKAIWVTRSFTVEWEPRSTGGEHTDRFSEDSAVPTAWATVTSENRKVAKRWPDVNVTEALARWLRVRKGMHWFRG